MCTRMDQLYSKPRCIYRSARLHRQTDLFRAIIADNHLHQHHLRIVAAPPIVDIVNANNIFFFSNSDAALNTSGKHGSNPRN